MEQVLELFVFYLQQNRSIALAMASANFRDTGKRETDNQ